VSKNSYKHAPLALALIEIRHPTTGYLSRGDLAAIKQQLVGVAPLQKEENVTEIQMMMQGNAMPVGPPTSRTVHRFLTRDRLTSIAYGPDSMAIETTAYQGWTALKRLTEQAIIARMTATPIDGVERVGIRFIDEIRTPDGANGRDWRGWVSDSLLAPDLGDGNLRPLQQQSVIQYQIGASSKTLTLRYGAADGPPVVVSGPNLVRAKQPGPGPYFLLDTDAAWLPSDGEAIPELQVEFVRETIEALHEPVSVLFESLITDKLRTEVLNRE
jgi:uncharacterized protein (TIGR04255 family)